MSSELDTLNELRQFIEERINELQRSTPKGGPIYPDHTSPNGNIKTFKFHIGVGGKFTYDPPGDWAYSGTNLVRFESDHGPFTVTAMPVPTGALGPYPGPWTTPLDAERDSTGKWFAQIYPYDSKLGPKVREALVEEQGFIAKYKYIIEAQRNGRPYRDDTHNGVYEC